MTDAPSLDRRRFFIDGDWARPHGDDVHVALEAATEDVLGVAAMGTRADVDDAVLAARRALDDGPWGRSAAGERADVMERFAAALRARSRGTSTLVSRENGMPLSLSTVMNGLAPGVLLEQYAQQARDLGFEEVRPSANGATLVRREPVGVVAAITPWNYPQALAMMKIAPALAAGCTVVLKPSPETALDAYVLADAAQEAGLPAGVLNIVLGDREVGAALVGHPLVDKVAFTGSTAAGRAIGAECGRTMKRMSLELGGKSAAIVLDDADLQVLLDNIGPASFMNNGQTCTTQARILAPRRRYDEVVDAISTYARSMVVGNPLDRGVTLGPMASEAHRERVLGMVEVGRSSGARLVTGGGRPAGLGRGWFVEPTVFADVENSDRLAREEVFGPVYAVVPHDGDDHAVELANDSEYGLAGSVWTADEDRGVAVARRVRTGSIGVNYYLQDLGAPFGGVKASGVGRELGPEAMASYLEYKSVYVSADLLG